MPRALKYLNLTLSLGPLSVAVAQGAAAELVWRVLEVDPAEEADPGE